VTDERHLLINLILYGLLPLWGIAGFIDWCCHRATKVESTSGLKESLIHSLMGIQLGIPILLCLLFEINVLILLICVAMWLLHEVVAHWDVHYASPRQSSVSTHRQFRPRPSACSAARQRRATWWCPGLAAWCRPGSEFPPWSCSPRTASARAA
jgi:hypothetical protein